ncbi:MAG: Glu/Leu/Phe/Val dehydrogenase dimerization domain-containing protein [Pirellulaceae bacterium]
MRAFESSTFYFNQAADILGLEESWRTLLLTPKREVQVQVPIEMDDGSLQTFIGYRVQHG